MSQVTLIMQKAISAVLLALFIVFPLNSFPQKGSFPEIKQLQSPQNPKLGFMIHAGAGVIPKASITPANEKELRAKLEEVVLAGYKALQAGKSSVEAVEIAIRLMEDSPLFNAGKGSAFNHDGKNELGASIMDGKTLAASSVADLRRVKNPISLARAVMDGAPQTTMIGDGAEQFAKEQKLDIVDEKYFWTQERWDQLQQVLKLEKQSLLPPANKAGSTETPASPPLKPFNSVGAVALDSKGNLASGTSAGGVTNMAPGSVSDAAIIGAGTYANNDTCAVAATDSGGFLVRLSGARDIAALMEYRTFPVQKAADLEIKQKLEKIGGKGGVIAMDKFGNMAVSFNTDGMYRAYIGPDGKPVVEIY